MKRRSMEVDGDMCREKEWKWRGGRRWREGCWAGGMKECRVEREVRLWEEVEESLGKYLGRSEEEIYGRCRHLGSSQGEIWKRERSG